MEPVPPRPRADAKELRAELIDAGAARAERLLAHALGQPRQEQHPRGIELFLVLERAGEPLDAGRRGRLAEVRLDFRP
ncbi:hypothetical protein [Sorangium sp. So ce887]|uniref:hypothetical protein n=1 Tax=Sorangium sp. So ce887 TaxID=3133324 RepID=UPI003F632CA6